MATPIKRNGRWRIQVQKNGVKKSFTADTKRECIIMAELWNGTKIIDITLGEAFRHYIEDGSNVYSPYTLDGYRTIARNSLLQLQKKPLCDITADDIQKAINEESKRLSPKSVRNVYGLYSAVMKKHGYDTPKIKLPQIKKSEIYIPTTEEVENLISRTKHEDVKLILQFCAYCGLRREEALALSYEDIFYDSTNELYYVKINKAIVESSQGIEIKPPKADASNRTVVVPFPVPEGTGRICDVTPKRLAQRISKMTGRKFGMHSLRHYYVANLIAEGLPIYYIAKRVGHSSTMMIEKTYGHLIKTIEKEYDRQICSPPTHQRCS